MDVLLHLLILWAQQSNVDTLVKCICCVTCGAPWRTVTTTTGPSGHLKTVDFFIARVRWANWNCMIMRQVKKQVVHGRVSPRAYLGLLLWPLPPSLTGCDSVASSAPAALWQPAAFNLSQSGGGRWVGGCWGSVGWCRGAVSIYFLPPSPPPTRSPFGSALTLQETDGGREEKRERTGGGKKTEKRNSPQGGNNEL